MVSLLELILLTSLVFKCFSRRVRSMVSLFELIRMRAERGRENTVTSEITSVSYH